MRELLDAYNKIIARGQCDCLVGTCIVEVVGLTGERCMNVVHDRLRDSRDIYGSAYKKDSYRRTTRPCVLTGVNTANAILPNLLVPARPDLLARLVFVGGEAYARLLGYYKTTSMT